MSIPKVFDPFSRKKPFNMQEHLLSVARDAPPLHPQVEEIMKQIANGVENAKKYKEQTRPRVEGFYTEHKYYDIEYVKQMPKTPYVESLLVKGVSPTYRRYVKEKGRVMISDVFSSKDPVAMLSNNEVYDGKLKLNVSLPVFLNTPSLVDELKDLSFMSDGKQILVSGNGTYCITSMRDKLDGTLYTVFKIHDQCWAFGGGSLHETTLPVGRYEKIGQVFYILDDVNPGKYFFSRAPVEAVEHRWFEPVSYIQAYKLKGEGEGIICKIGDLQYKIKRSWTIDVAVRRADDNVVYTDAGDFSRHRVNAKIGQIVECDIRSMNCVRVRHDKLRQENFYPLLNARSSDQMIVMMRKAEYFVKVKQGNLLPFPHLVSIAGSGALVTAHDLYISFMQDKCEHDFVATLNKSGVVIDGKRVVSHGVVQYSTNMKYNIDCRQETKDMLITNREKLAVYKHILNSDIDPLDLNAAYNYYREQDSTQYMKWSGVSAKNRMESYQKKKPFRKKPLSGYDVEQSWVDIGCGDGAITHAMGIPEVNLLNVDVVDRRYYQKSAEFKLFSEFGSGSKKYQNFLLNHSLHHMTDVEIGDCFKKIFQTAALGARIYLREHSVDSSNYNHIKALHVAYLLKEIPRYHGKEEFFSILDDEMGMLNLKDKSTWISTFVLAGFRLVVAGDPISHDNVFVSVFEVG